MGETSTYGKNTPLRSLYSDNELVGRVVKVISKNSKYLGKCGKIVGFCNGRYREVKVYIEEVNLCIHISRGFVELVE